MSQFEWKKIPESFHMRAIADESTQKDIIKWLQELEVDRWICLMLDPMTMTGLFKKIYIDIL